MAASLISRARKCRGAKITLTDAATGLQRTTTSNEAGLYQFLDVPPGNYRLDATATGFAPYVASKVTLIVKTPSTVNIQFQVAGVATTVTVEGQAPLINRTDASLGNTVEQNQIAQLPIADRNVVQLLSLQPGVAYLGNQLDESTRTPAAAQSMACAAINPTSRSTASASTTRTMATLLPAC